MKSGLLFPGQGSQFVGMGQSLARRFPEAREVFEEADDILRFGLSGSHGKVPRRSSPRQRTRSRRSTCTVWRHTG